MKIDENCERGRSFEKVNSKEIQERKTAREKKTFHEQLEKPTEQKEVEAK